MDRRYILATDRGRIAGVLTSFYRKEIESFRRISARSRPIACLTIVVSACRRFDPAPDHSPDPGLQQGYPPGSGVAGTILQVRFQHRGVSDAAAYPTRELAEEEEPLLRAASSVGQRDAGDPASAQHPARGRPAERQTRMPTADIEGGSWAGRWRQALPPPRAHGRGLPDRHLALSITVEPTRHPRSNRWLSLLRPSARHELEPLSLEAMRTAAGWNSSTGLQALRELRDPR